jgi:GNAT superfamily N-acetyltransferase
MTPKSKLQEIDDRVDRDHKYDPQPEVKPRERTEKRRYGWSIPSPPDVGSLTLTRERERQPVDAFVNQWHTLELGPGWKACFGARYRDRLVAVCVIGRPKGRHADDGTELAITRYCARPDAPQNTGSWLIAQARDWARLEGYDTISAHAGVAGNLGNIYQAAGFDLVDESEADGDNWTSRRGRSGHGNYTRRKYVYEL